MNEDAESDAFSLRAALIEATGADRKVSPEEKRLKILSIGCYGITEAHARP